MEDCRQAGQAGGVASGHRAHLQFTLLVSLCKYVRLFPGVMMQYHYHCFLRVARDDQASKADDCRIFSIYPSIPGAVHFFFFF